MDNAIYNRTEHLKKKLNSFLIDFNSEENNYFEKLDINSLLKLKSAISDINNILTLKTTLALTNWIVDAFNLSTTEKNRLLDEINRTKPNTNGFDIQVVEKKIIAEIKCIVPINNGNYYGAAQRNSILDDANKLMNGKRVLRNTSDHIKIIGLIDLNEKTDIAIEKLLVPVKNIRTKQKIRIDRHNVVQKLKILDNKTLETELNTEFVYIKKIALPVPNNV